MLHYQNEKPRVVTFKHFARKNYAAFRSIKKEIRIGCLAVSMLTFAHNSSVASRQDSLQIASQKMPEVTLDKAEVTGQRVPVTLTETANKVHVITRKEIEAAKVQSVNDLLKLCIGVDVRQRGGFGIQTDISIGGSTFDQISILLNGISLNNPQTGHLSADFPVAIADIERIEVYDGASARTFGSQALNGAINIITRTENKNVGGAHAEGGSHGTFGGGAFLNMATQYYLNRVSADYIRSDGGTDNSAFHKYRAYYLGHYITPEMKLTWQGGFSSQRYGANTFYSARYPNQWEAGSRWMASVKAVTNGRIHLAPTLSWVRTFDHFQLIHNTHTGENFHRNDVFTAGLTAYSNWQLGRTAVGGEIRQEAILSSNLGRPLSEEQYVKVEGQQNIYYNHRDNRTNVSFFAEHNVILNRFSLSAGVMGNRNTAINDRFSFYPGIDMSYRPTDGLKIFGAWNMSMRLPTFTDLYYKSPTQEGNVGLRPEKASTFKLGTDWTKGALTASVSGIYRYGTDMIDWVMFTSNDIYHSTNFKIDNYELQTQLGLDLKQLLGEAQPLQSISAGYTYNNQQRHDHQVIFQSNYALDYLRHKMVGQLSHHIWKDLSAAWYLRWQKRMGHWLDYDGGGNAVLHDYHPYALLSLKLDWKKPNYDLYASFENLTNHKYYDLGAVRQPGLWWMVGGSIRF
ncbi:MAG: TonB-dependent receptor [Bacteroidaceae bacterium]|nr:TonB-dependent receptor [Bacteroidaceae bacterium]